MLVKRLRLRPFTAASRVRVPYTLPIIKMKRYLNKIPVHYEVVYFEHYTLPFLREQVWKDFGFTLSDPTHAKILLKLID